MSQDNELNDLNRRINDKASIINDLKRRSILECTDKYDTNIAVITGEIAVLSLEKNKIIKQKQRDEIERKNQEIIKKVESNISLLRNREDELRCQLTENLSFKVSDLIKGWDTKLQSVDKEKEIEKCKVLIESLDEYKRQKDIFRNQVINYKRKLEKIESLTKYSENLITMITNIDNLRLFHEDLILSVRAYSSEVDREICNEIIRNSKFECCICQEEISKDDIFVIGICEHEMCRNCARETYKMAIRERTLPPPCPKCSIDPCEKCPVNKGNSSKESKDKYCTISDIDFQTLLNDEEWIKYQNAMKNQIALNDPEHYLKCPNDECKMIIYKDDNDDCHIICHACQYEWCSNCNVDWHKDMNCDEYQEWRKDNEKEDETFEEAKKQGYLKKCPKCNNYGKKVVHECNKATCPICSTKFCWLCLTNLTDLVDPYSHFNDKNSSCYDKLFEGCIQD